MLKTGLKTINEPSMQISVAWSASDQEIGLVLFLMENLLR